MYREESISTSHRFGWLKWCGIGVVVFALFLITKPFTIISAGEVGVVYSFGSIINQLDEGFHLIAPWHFVTHANTRVQREVLESLASFSKETQDVFVKASLNYQVSPKTIQNLYRTIGKDYYHILIEPRVAQLFKDETVKYNTVEIAPNRENIRQAVRGRLETELAPYSIHIVDLLLDNIDFNKEFQAAILRKQIATQKALEEEQLVAAAKQRANQQVETERGQGAAALARAEKLALANQQIAASLTPALLQYEYLKKWNGVKSLVEGSGAGVFLQMPTPTK
jgi:regulator of protease activity HflC (stomatin/prohibitin superfamily)